jgi:glycosyltransferase involved in cell wall biosynthesis
MKLSHQHEALHVGCLGDLPGGIAQVVNAYKRAASNEWKIRSICTVRRPRDPLSPVLWLRGALVTIWFVLRGRSGILIAHLSQRGSFLREGSLVYLGAVLKLPTIAYVHGSSFPRFARAHPSLVRKVLTKADRVLVLSRESASAVAELGLADRCHQIPNLVSVQSDVLPAESRIPMVLFAGEVSRRKGVDILLEAWDELGDECRGHPWRLVIAGPCVEDPQSKSNGNVDFMGAVEHSRVLDLLGKASIAILPSRAEALPMFVLEAMAAGCAVVATDVGGIQQLLGDSGERGLCVPAGDARQVTNALKTLMFDIAERRRVAEAARSYVRVTHSTELNFDRIVGHWEEARNAR